jgi:hypothetical protein
VDQPDLFAKHFLVGPHSEAFTILDWQRAVLRRSVSWPRRLRGLAALRATFPPGSDSAWAVLIAAYLDEASRDAGSVPVRFHESIESVAAGLARRRGIASQRLSTSAPVSQELVRIGGERVCAIPEVATALEDESAIAALYDPSADGRIIELPGGRTGLLRVRRHRLPFGRWWAALRLRAWRSPELRAARLLFHLERHGIPAPRLLAYGQTVRPAAAFLLIEPIKADPPGAADSSAARQLLDRVHDAGCRLLKVGPNGEPFGVVAGGIVIAEVNRIRLAKRLTGRQIRHDRERLDAFFRGLP